MADDGDETNNQGIGIATQWQAMGRGQERVEAQWEERKRHRSGHPDSIEL